MILVVKDSHDFKGTISVNYRSIRVDECNTVFFGLIPAGKSVQNIPINNVSGVTINTAYKLSRMVLGVIEFLNGIITTLSIEKSGSSYDLAVPFFDKSKIQEAADAINKNLDTHEDKGDLNL
ncbi:hypothetical protein [Fructilactobacillus carniphilus]|uniref:Uncharacterized protein n=1 Tax=Fructilactobacillus carniphilus TaxID=2940297 RepID=A0ABY5BZ91_9LACO|nr:hypothetical protein [Fructilactobacillus carniphilus]USS90355.1 hypothetical protein M3M37_05810 [Fructilactobacillus carniphilus]